MDDIDRFHAVFHAAPGPLALVGSNGKIVFANAALNRLFEYGDGELDGHGVEILVPLEFRDSHPELRTAYFDLPRNREMGTGRNLFGVTKSGREVPVEIGLSHIKLDNSSWTLASVLDLTERSRNEERLRMAVDAASSAMVMVDDKGAIALANTQATQTFGYKREELLGQAIEMLIPADIRRRHTVYRASYGSDPTVRTMGRGRELFGLRKDGTRFPVEIGLTPFKAQDGDFIMATIIDITERKAAESAIREQNEKLASLNEELMQFAYSASHDLKAPLSTISGLLKYVDSDLESGNTEEAIRNTKRARELTVKLAGLIEDLLDLAKNDGIDEPFEIVDIGAMANEITASLEGSIVAMDVTATTDCGDDPTLKTQRTRMKQVLENLIANGINYADAAKPEKTLDVSFRRHDGYGVISVADNGIGIPEDKQSQVFKMFQRFGNHTVPGSGLGLALVKKNVDALCGSIEFRSSSQGTEFTIMIPIGG